MVNLSCFYTNINDQPRTGERNDLLYEINYHRIASSALCAGAGQPEEGPPGDGVCAQPQGHGENRAHAGGQDPGVRGRGRL